MRTRTLILIVALGIIVAVGLPRMSLALSLVPPSIEYDLQPGQTQQAQIKLYNETDNGVILYSSVASFGAKDENGAPDFTFAETPTGLASWIDYPKGALNLPANGKMELTVTISVPKDAEPGGHYAGVFFGNQLPKTTGNQVSIQSLLGSLVIIRVAGDVREAATVAQLGLDGGKTTLTRLPATLFARIQNTGNVHVRPEGTIQIKNMFGKNSANLTINDLSGAVLPNSIRRFDAVWGNTSATENKGFISEIAAEWKNFRLGTYTATVNLAYGQSKQTLTGTVKFTIIPWRLLLVEFLVLAGLIILIVFGLKRYNAAIINRAEKHIRPIPPTGKG